MMSLLVFKEKLKKFYNKHDVYVNPAIKCIVTIITLFVINANIGYMDQLKNPAIVVIAGLICSFLPSGVIVVISSIFILAHLYAVSMEVAVVTFVIILIMLLVYFRYTPKDSLILVLTPVLFYMKIPYVVPILMGLIGGYISVIPVSFGVILYFILQYTNDNIALINQMGEESSVQKFTLVIDALVKNPLMLLTIIAFIAVLITVNVIKRLSIDYSWSIAIAIGGIINVLILLIGSLLMDISKDNNIVFMILGTIVSMVICYVLHFLIFTVDYSRTEYTQFEDDEYYYYVKAVPKLNVTAPEVNVKRINAHRISRVKR